MKKNKFNTIEEAKVELEKKRVELYSEIKNNNDVILADNSFVNYVSGKYIPRMLIFTRNMINDIKNHTFEDKIF